MTLRYLWNRIIKKIKGVAIRDSFVHSTSKIEAGSQFVNSRMEKFSYCGYDCKIINCDIGSFTSIADNVVIGGIQHPMTWISMSPVFYKGRDSVKRKFSEYQRDADKKTIVKNDVWIGEGALIKAGCKIETGAVIGMGSVVTHNVGAYEIWAGNPARLIRKRFKDEEIYSLLKSEWWNLDDSEISRRSLYVKDPMKFIEGLI